jgi:DNA-binding transcriptional regulator YiaG
MTSDNFSNLLQHVLDHMRELEEMSTQGEDGRIKELVSLRVKAYRLEYKLTQSELATQLGVDRMQIIRWESGKHKPGKLALKMLKEKRIIPEVE